MELDTKKKKYRLSSSATPSPSEENKSFSNGFYHKNITGFEGEPSTTNGKGTPAFDNLAYASHDDDNVFKPKTDIYFDPSSLQRNQKGHQKGHLSRVESAREENVPDKKGEKGCLILLFVLTVLGLLAGVAVILYVQVFKAPVKLVGSVTLKDAWNEELRIPSSLIYNTTAANITSEMDSIMQNVQVVLRNKNNNFFTCNPGINNCFNIQINRNINLIHNSELYIINIGSIQSISINHT
uniref:Uncharacterized protein n=1 Tax=Magallana gigas TaxID=29159 RepID=K1Q8K6_MAGGI